MAQIKNAAKIILIVLVVSIIGNVLLLVRWGQDRAEIAEMAKKNAELRQSFDLYVETEQRAKILRKEEEDVYKDEQKAAKAALDAATDWAHHALPDDIRGVLKKAGSSPIPATGGSAR